MTTPPAGQQVLASLREDIAAGLAQVQSPYLYLQAAGSDGTDGSATGIHLRWDLLRDIGARHLPKGDLAVGPQARYPAAHGFNKTDDYVRLLRIPYFRRYPCTVNFDKDDPATLVESGQRRLWTFKVAAAGTDKKLEVVIRFNDVAQYDAIRKTLNPAKSALGFLRRYTGVVEAEVTGKLCFCASFGVTAPTKGDSKSGPAEPDPGEPGEQSVWETIAAFAHGVAGAVASAVGRVIRPGGEAEAAAGTMPARIMAFIQGTSRSALRVEAIAVAENLPGSDLYISCRRRFSPALAGPSPTPYRVCAENTLYVRFDYANCVPLELQLETYEQFIFGSLGAAGAGWQAVPGDFAVSDQDAVVYPRLENPTHAMVDGHWPRYLGANPTTGLFITSVPNCKAKWDPTRPPLQEPSDAAGLRRGVINYLTLSQSASNPTALASLQSNDPNDAGAFDMSYLTMLKLVALDFHAARMLGLGYIDSFQPTPYPVVHLAIYRTTAALEAGGKAAKRTHLSMSLPTWRTDFRLPPPPVQDPPTFGVSADYGTGAGTPLTDANGYSLFEDSRTINLHVRPYDVVQPFGPFFVPPVEFCSSDVTGPVFYGCKYKKTSEANYRAPELSNDPEFHDGSGIAEVAPLLPQGAATPYDPRPPIFVHDETESGVHRYAFYAINWFSRPSGLGNPQDVNSQIPARHMLLPPANFAVQLIQPEDPLILTTQHEQQKLAALPAADATLVRCTFDWNDSHYIPQKFSAANAYANEVELYFRQAPPRAVQGAIKSVTSLSGGLAEIRTQSYVIASASPPETVSPAVVAGDEPRFVGGSFAADQILYTIHSVAQPTVPGEGAVFVVRALSQASVADLDGNNVQAASVQVTIPSAGARFLAVENMNAPANWGANLPLAKKVALKNFLTGGQLHAETVSYADGSQKTFNIGGILESADIFEIKDVSAPSGATVPNSRTGMFEIVFTAYQLASHPDPDVEWYRGKVRIEEASTGARKALDVWRIDTGGATLKLLVYDPTFNVDGAYAPLPGYNPIKTGAGIMVNFHPGYRVYLTKQAGVLDKSTTLPGPLQSGKQTFLAARARNGTLAVASNLTQPVPMQARRLSPPLAPAQPGGPLYATRPDFYGKSSWTMDVQVVADSTRQPYALVFYRANEQTVLDTLYAPATVAAIRTALAGLAPGDAAFDANRWSDLVNVANLHADHGFAEHTAGGFRFPVPDNIAYLIPGTGVAPFDGVKRPGDPGVTVTVGGTQIAMLDVVKSAIEGAFLPLTEAPVIYQFLKSATQTSSVRGRIRDANGDLLAHSDPAFDPTPMAVRHAKSGSTYVRFTDYSLDGAALNRYFYYAMELSEELKFSPRSPIAGPVQLVNAYPAETPVIRSVTSLIADPRLPQPTGVRIVVNPYLAAEGISAFNLYRATNPADATSVRTMQMVKNQEAVPGAETELVDDFQDLAFPPYGDPIFYRVVAQREIVNEMGVKELIPSQPSSAAGASVIDIDNPPAPPIVFNSDPPTISNPVQLHNVELSWPIVTHNATYRLFRQDRSGNWTLIHSVKSNASPVVVPLAATNLGTDMLSKQDQNGTPVRHLFKLEVENASGLFSLNEEVLSIPASRSEGYSAFSGVLSYQDDFQPPAPLSDRVCDPAVSTFPGTMTFQDIIGALPRGHVFDRIEVTVADRLGHAARKAITAAGGTVAFQHGDGTGIILDGSSINASYDVTARVFTDSCPEGFLFSHKLRYGPELELLDLAAVLTYADGGGINVPLDHFFSAGGASFPTTMTFVDAAVLPAGHAFVRIDVTVEDDLGSVFTRSINAAAGAATFNHGDGGLVLDGSEPNLTYKVTARLFTSLSPNGVEFAYFLPYA